MKKIFYALIAVCCLLAGCERDSKKNDKPEVALLMCSQTNDFRTAMTVYAKRALDETRLKYKVYAADNAAEQAAQVLDAIERGVKVMIVTPEGTDLDAFTPALEAGVRLVFVEDNAGVANYAALVRVNNTEVGENAGEYVAASDASLVAIFNVAQDEAASDPRVAGFKSKIGDIAVVDKECATYTRAAGKVAAEEVFASHPNVDAFYAQDDEIALGVLDAIEQAGRDDIKVVVGCAGSQAFFAAIKQSEVPELATTLYSPSMVVEAVHVAAEIVDGDDYVREIIEMPATVIDKDNVDDYIDATSPY